MSGSSSHRQRCHLVTFGLFFLLQLVWIAQSFVIIQSPRRSHHSVRPRQVLADNELMDDQELLSQVTIDQLTGLCDQMHLPNEGTKEEILHRLREYAANEAELERQRLAKRNERVEEGSDNAKERYEILGGGFVHDDDPDDDEAEGFFYFELPEKEGSKTEKPAQKKKKKKKPSQPPVVDNTMVTAPPPPVEPNENGERVVTVYSSSDKNDLTGVAAAQPGSVATAGGDLMTAASPVGDQPWDREQQQSKTTSQQEMERAKEQVCELVQVLLATTGAPAFASMDDDELMLRIPSYEPQRGFVGFNPASVPNDFLEPYSRSVRTGRGEVLKDVLRQFELQGIGQDGMAGDDQEKGGGHYREVSKVSAFLEGFRRAENRRLARETTAMLLDKLVLEGVRGLDLMLATMIKASDDTSTYAGELNDSLLDYLSDAIRQQQAKVEQLGQEDDSVGFMEMDETTKPNNIDHLWEVSYDEDGEKVESIDPTDPTVHKALRLEFDNESTQREQLPSSPQKQLLLLLTLLRDRVKAEAAFGPDEKGRNLRLLAYCLQVDTRKEREGMIMGEMGSSLDRLDSFQELIASSIEYGESTAYQLKPAKKVTLDLKQLKSILRLVKDVRHMQSLKASNMGM